jgi:hypothetical protein
MTQETVTSYKLPMIEALEQTEKRKYTSKDVAAMLRQKLKVFYPECKFSVRYSSYSGGSSIGITLLSSPFAAWKTWDELTEVEQLRYSDNGRRTRAEFEKMQAYGNKQINQYWINDEDGEYTIKPEVRDILRDVANYVNQYNYDNSDSRVDYFDVHFYVDYSIGSYDKPYMVVKQ